MAKGTRNDLASITEQIIRGQGTAMPPRVRGSGAIGAPVELARFSVDYQSLEREVDELKKTAGKAIRVKLERCDDGPHHTSPLDLERVAGLKANMATNGQSAPALLRPKPDGRFEIVAGRHRKAALIELGEDEWDAVIKDIDDDAAERLTFYDNLLAPNLTDFAKYRGFAQRRKTRGYTNEQLAAESGLAERMVRSLLSFDQLTPSMLRLAEENPARITYTLVESLAPHLPTKPAKVEEVLRMVATTKDMTYAQALAHVMKPDITPTPKRSAPVIVKSGKKVYAELVRREGRLVVTLKGADPEEAAKVEGLIHQLLKERSAASKG